MRLFFLCAEEREQRAYRRNCRLEDVGQFECEAIIGTETYVGEASNKAEAKMAAAELAFQVKFSMVVFEANYRYCTRLRRSWAPRPMWARPITRPMPKWPPPIWPFR
jgi:hypothetical protein